AWLSRDIRVALRLRVRVGYRPVNILCDVQRLRSRGKIERTVARRFSLDETFDVGADTGTPVVEDYADKMPFRFTGMLKRLVIELRWWRPPIFRAGGRPGLGP